MAKCFQQSSENAGIFSTGVGFPSALLRYVVKAAGFALTSSMARTNRSQRSRELVGRMTGGGLISGQDSLVTSSNLGRYSSSFARWRSKGDEKDNSVFIETAVPNMVLKTSGTGSGRRQKTLVCHAVFVWRKCCVTKIRTLFIPFRTNFGRDFSVLHCASLLRTIFASLGRANECVHVHNERNFPQAQ